MRIWGQWTGSWNGRTGNGYRISAGRCRPSWGRTTLFRVGTRRKAESMRGSRASVETAIMDRGLRRVVGLSEHLDQPTRQLRSIGSLEPLGWLGQERLEAGARRAGRVRLEQRRFDQRVEELE